MKALFHVTGLEAYKQIVKDRCIKPGPKNVWVVREPVGYIRKGGVVWLCEAEQIPRVKKHLAQLGKDNRMTISVMVELGPDLRRFYPWPGVWMSRVKVYI